MRLRFAQQSDLPAMRQLYRDTVSHVCNADYSPEQIAVWLQTAGDLRRWQRVMELQKVVIAERNSKMLGFGTLRDNDYIDFFYISKDFQRKGVAKSILAQLEHHAIAGGAQRITADVSITARTFFEKYGYNVVKEQHNLRGGVELVNYLMEKNLKA